MRFKFLASATLLACAAVAPVSALTINLTDTGGVTPGTQAYAGFRAAADFWQSVISTNVTVELNVGFTSAGFSSPNIIGQTASTRFTGLYLNDIYAAMAATGNSRLDGIAAANMSPLTPVPGFFGGTSGAVNAITQKAKPNGTGVVQNTRGNNPITGGVAAGLSGIELVSNREYDTDGSRNNHDLRVNSSVLKALGFGDDIAGAYNGVDGVVTFNSAFNFDFDPRNGVGAGQIDFIGTAIHEIGHALGFVSGVDIYDGNTNFGGKLDDNSLMSTLDLFRYSDDVTNLVPGSGQVLDWSVGNSATATDNLFGRPYFSFDGHTKGLSAYGGDTGYFSTGQTNGDGRQASHWMDTPYAALPGNGVGTQCLAPIGGSRGILDPTFAGCELGTITSLDLAAFDAMGWNLYYDVLTPNGIAKKFTSANALNGIGAVPEPATWALMIGGFGLVGVQARRRRSGYATA